MTKRSTNQINYIKKSLAKRIFNSNREIWVIFPAFSNGRAHIYKFRVVQISVPNKIFIYFSVWLRNRLLSAGLEPVFSQKLCIASNYRQFSTNMKIKRKAVYNLHGKGTSFEIKSFSDIFYDNLLCFNSKKIKIRGINISKLKLVWLLYHINKCNQKSKIDILTIW